MRGVYLIVSEDERYKIGYTGNLKRRKKQLENASGLKMEVLVFFETQHAVMLETYLKRHFAALNTLGEWFALTRENVEGFKGMCSKIDNGISVSFKGNEIFKKTHKKWDSNETLDA